MARQWADRPEGLEESARIAARCDFSLAWMRPPLPRFDVEPGHTDDSFLRECVYAGARERWGTVTPEQDAAARARARRHLAARLRGVLPGDVGGGALGALAGHPLPGTRERGELGGRLLPRHHRGGPGEARAPLRALPLRGAGGRPDRGARHRPRRGARPARGAARSRLRQVEALVGGDRLHRAALPGAQRPARRHARARLSGRARLQALQAPPLRGGRRRRRLRARYPRRNSSGST